MTESIKSFFGFKKMPFSKHIGVNKLFQSSSFKEALSRLEIALENEDITLITGSIGSGKSNVLRYFTGKLDANSYKPIYIPADKMKPGEIAKKALKELNMEIPFHGSAAMRKLKQSIIKLNKHNGIKPILVIDEAQQLPIETLLSLKNLLNFNMDSENLLCIILCGQKELNEILDLSPLESLRRRIRIKYHLAPLTLEETAQYIHHHLRVCGLERQLFTDDSKATIFHYSKGILCEINRICFEAIIHAVSLSKDLIEPSMLKPIVSGSEEFMET